MSITRSYLLAAALVTLAAGGITASSPRSKLAPAAVQPSSPASGEGRACPAAGASELGAAALGGEAAGAPQPNTVCKPGTGCCVWITPHICGQCSPHCSAPVAGDGA